MRLLILSLLCSIILQSCSKEENSAYQSSDLNSANVKNSLPNLAFEGKSKGLYVGSVVSSDMEFHGKILVNAGNDDKFNALIELPNDENIVFIASDASSEKMNNIEFQTEDSNSSFTLDLSDHKQPIASNVIINNVASNMVLLKDDLKSRASVLIGTYVDINDDSFSGTFDIYSKGDIHPYDNRASLVSKTALTSPGGSIFVDEIMENFDFSICLNDDSQVDFQPLMYVKVDETDAHFYADKQTMTVAGSPLNWQIFKEKGQKYHVQIQDVPGQEDGCYETYSGFWNWNGRNGTINFEFRKGPETSSDLTQFKSNSSIQLTSELIEAVLAN